MISISDPEDLPASVLDFSRCSSPEVVRSICHQSVPGWSLSPKEGIKIDQLCEGLSNQNFRVHAPPGSHSTSIPCVLFRAYGTDSDTLYDMEVEKRTCGMLSNYGIGPKMYASGDGWRIEEWHFSVPLPNRSMRNPSIFVQVAAHIARLHKLSGRPDFPRAIFRMSPACEYRLKTWGEGCRQAARSLTHPDYEEKVAALDIEEMLAERAWVKDFIVQEDPKIRGSGLDVVFSHWDGQENNILQTHYGLRFIDFEYAGMEYQAFDISSYFVECTIDYLETSYPFYKVNLSDFPSDWEQRMFCSIYLSEYLGTTVRPEDIAVEVLLERVRRFTLMGHLLWSLWSVIRAPQAPTFGGFDYLHYAQSRWFMYKWAKRAMLHQTPKVS